MNDFFLIARITSISGSEGFLNLQLITDFPQNLFMLKEVYIDFFGMKKKIFVENIRKTRKSFQIKFERFNSTRELQVLLNREVYITGSNLARLPEGSYFIHDLIDFEVWREDKFLGRIKDVLKMPANDIFVIIDESGNELLIPFVLSFIETFNETNRKIILKPGYGEYDNDEN